MVVAVGVFVIDGVIVGDCVGVGVSEHVLLGVIVGVGVRVGVSVGDCVGVGDAQISCDTIGGGFVPPAAAIHPVEGG